MRALLLAPLLTACVVLPIPVPNGTPGAFVFDEGDPCGARGLQGYVGRTGAEVEATAFTAPVRVAGPADATAPDPARVTFRTDAAGVVTAVACG